MLNMSIKEITLKINKGELSAAKLFAECLKRAEATSALNAFVSLNREPTKATSGSLRGVPIATKDNFCTKSLATTCGSKMLLDFEPNFDATVVTKLLDEGASLLGKTNLDEFAMGSGTVDSVHGPTKNLWGSPLNYKLNGKPRKSQSAWRIAGGSSGGSAVAVATGAVFGGIGSDSGGSTRNPASYCGVVGFKPSYASVSRHGLIPLVNSMDVPGVLARGVEDATLIYNAILGEDVNDSTTVPVDRVILQRLDSCWGKKIGIPKEYHSKGLSKEVHEVWKFVANLIESCGGSVLPVSMPHTAYSIACYTVLNQCEVASNMARFDGLRYGYSSDNKSSTNQLFAESRRNSLNKVVRGRILAGNYFLLAKNYEQYFEKALKVRRLIQRDFDNVWNSVDFLLTPTTLTEAPLLSEFLKYDNRQQSALNDYCTQPANMTGCPAISIPIALSKNELPLSIQLMSPNFSESPLLSLALFLEQQVNFPEVSLDC